MVLIQLDIPKDIDKKLKKYKKDKELISKKVVIIKILKKHLIEGEK